MTPKSLSGVNDKPKHAMLQTFRVYRCFSFWRYYWDYGDLSLYRYTTGIHLLAVLRELLQIDNCPTTNTRQINMIYDKVIQILSYGAGYCIPSYKKSFLKHWWDTELDYFKSRSVASCRVWKAAGQGRINR